MVQAQDGLFLDISDESGNKIGFVKAYDLDLGFILVYNDLEYDTSNNKFNLKSMRVKRIYTKFTVNG